MNIESKEKFKVIKPENGKKLTSYKEGDDISKYTSFNEFTCPLSVDISKFTEISVEQDIEYKKLAKEAILKQKSEKYDTVKKY